MEERKDLRANDIARGHTMKDFEECALKLEIQTVPWEGGFSGP